MKRFRLISVIVMIVAVGAVLATGIFSVIKNNSGVANQIVFDSGDNNVMVEVHGQYIGPTLEASYRGNETYEGSLTRSTENTYNSSADNLTPWQLGKTDLTSSEPTIEFDFQITNLNNKHNLKVNISKIACSESNFTTKYALANDANALEEQDLTPLQTVENDTTTIPEFTIEKIDGDTQHTTYIRIVFELRNYNTPFNFDNNMLITFSDVPTES